MSIRTCAAGVAMLLLASLGAPCAVAAGAPSSQAALRAACAAVERLSLPETRIALRAAPRSG